MAISIDLTKIHNKSIRLKIATKFDNYQHVKDRYGYGYLYPQSFCFDTNDPNNSEIFIAYEHTEGNDGYTWFQIVDAITGAQKALFSAGSYCPEGIAVVYEDGVRQLLVRGPNATTEIYEVPLNIGDLIAGKDLSDLTDDVLWNSLRLTTSRRSNTGHKYQASEYNGLFLIEDYETSTKRDLFSLYSTSDVLNQTNPDQLQVMEMELFDSSFGKVFPKRQSVALGSDYIIAGYGGCQQFAIPTTPYGFPGIKVFDQNLKRKATTTYNPQKFVDLLSSELSFTPTRIENEGICVTPINVYNTSSSESVFSLWILDGTGNSENGSVMVLEEFSNDENAIDFSPISTPDSTTIQDELETKYTYTSSALIKYNLFSIKSIIDYMVFKKITNFSFYTTGISITDCYGEIIKEGCLVQAVNCNGNTFFFEARKASYLKRFLVSGVSGNTYTQQNDVVSINNGTPTAGSEACALSSYGKGTIDLSRPGTSESVRMRFYNPNGQVGGIYTDGSTTKFNTTSDERLKDVVGEINDGLDIVSQLVEKGAVKKYAFKNNPNKIESGFLAQTTNEIFPDMVVVGEGEPDAEIGSVCGKEITPDNTEIDIRVSPWGVDPSKLVPVLTAAIYELSEKVTKLEKRINETN